MALTGIVHMGAYLRKMAIDGYVVNLEIQEFKEIIRLLGIANNNINQIAHKMHSFGLEETYHSCQEIINVLLNLINESK